MRRLLALAGVAALSLVAVSPVGAEHSAGEAQTSIDLGLGFRFGPQGFTLNGRVDGPGGPWGLRLDGRLRSEGFTLDGRIHDAERGYDFRLDGSLTAIPKL